MLITASIVVALDHYLRGVYWPQSVYGTVSPGSLRWLEHTAWVIFEDIFLIIVIRQANVEMESAAYQTAQLEWNHDQLQVAKEQAEAWSEATIATHTALQAMEKLVRQATASP